MVPKGKASELGLTPVKHGCRYCRTRLLRVGAWKLNTERGGDSSSVLLWYRDMLIR